MQNGEFRIRKAMGGELSTENWRLAWLGFIAGLVTVVLVYLALR